MLADAWAFLLTTRPVKLPIEAVPTAFAKDGITNDENAVHADWTTTPTRGLYLRQIVFRAAHASATLASLGQSARLWPGHIDIRPVLVFDLGIHLSHEGSWQLACAAFVELLRICGGESKGGGAGGCTTLWRGGAWTGAWRSGLAACENRDAPVLVHGHLY